LDRQNVCHVKTVLFGATPTINNDRYLINTRLLKNKVHYLRVNSASPKRGSRVRIRVRYCFIFEFKKNFHFESDFKVLRLKSC
jgi:hypothetical protein